jgi:hypothetical protein
VIGSLKVCNSTPRDEISGKLHFRNQPIFKAKLRLKADFRLNGFSTINSPANCEIILKIKTITTKFFYSFSQAGYSLNQQLNKKRNNKSSILVDHFPWLYKTTYHFLDRSSGAFGRYRIQSFQSSAHRLLYAYDLNLQSLIRRDQQRLNDRSYAL